MTMGRRKQCARKSTGGKAVIAPFKKDPFTEKLSKLKRNKKFFGSSYEAKLNVDSCPESCSRYSVKELSVAFEELVKWCVNGEVGRIRSALEDTNKLIYKDLFICPQIKDAKSRYTIPEIVSSNGNVEVMNLILLKRGVDFDLGKCFDIAFVKNNVKMVDRFMKLPLPIIVESYFDKVKEFSSWEMLKTLVINAKLEDDDKDKVLVPAFRLAIKFGNMDIIRFLILNGANVNGSDDLSTPLIVACRNGKYEIVEYLLSQGASPFLRDQDVKQTPLEKLQYDADFGDNKDFKEKTTNLLTLKMKENRQKAASGCDYEAKYSKCDVHSGFYGPYSENEPEEKTFQNLITYCLKGQSGKINKAEHEACLKHCIQDLDSGYRAIDFAVLGGHPEVVEILLDLGAIPEIVNDSFITPHDAFYHSAIDLAIEKEREDLVLLLIEKGMKPKDFLFYAVRKNNSQIFTYASNMIMDIDGIMIDSESMYSESDNGMTALHVASMLGKLEAVKFLLDHGANIDKKDGKHQRSALDIAKMKKHNALVE